MCNTYIPKVIEYIQNKKRITVKNPKPLFFSSTTSYVRYIFKSIRLTVDTKPPHYLQHIILSRSKRRERRRRSTMIFYFFIVYDVYCRHSTHVFDKEFDVVL